MSDLVARLRKDRDDGRCDEDAFLKWEAADAIEGKSPQAPIALLTINEAGEVAGISQFAPGLPPGEHRLYCEPEATAPYLREQPFTDGHMTWWLVKYPDRPSALMTDEEFIEWADRVKYDGIEYDAQPLRRADQPRESP